jgi:hypothetical protein
MPRRRNFEVFTLSFLDCICCGFGAVILFYTIISAQSGVNRVRNTESLTAQVNLLEEQVLEGTKNLVRLRNTLQKTESETTSASSRATQLIEELRRQREERSIYDQTTLAKRERIAKLMADVKALQDSTRRLEASAQAPMPQGERAGAGKTLADRRYITGLALKGKRILVLVDRSASMLDEDLVNIIRLRNSPDAAKRAALKWRRTVDIASWIAAQMPLAAQYQMYGFNTQPAPLIAGTEGKWLSASDNGQVDATLAALEKLVPQDGTSLLNAFRVIREMQPAPDQVIVITDGLPTQGASPPALRRYVDANARAKLFDEATRGLTAKNMPIDTVLLPMKGDIPASHRFWMLARATGGSFVMPSPDWP